MYYPGSCPPFRIWSVFLTDCTTGWLGDVFTDLPTSHRGSGALRVKGQQNLDTISKKSKWRLMSAADILQRGRSNNGSIMLNQNTEYIRQMSLLQCAIEKRDRKKERKEREKKHNKQKDRHQQRLCLMTAMFCLNFVFFSC